VSTVRYDSMQNTKPVYISMGEMAVFLDLDQYNCPLTVSHFMLFLHAKSICIVTSFAPLWDDF